MKGWRRVDECRLCGNFRCVVSTVNPRMGYCFRFGESFWLSNDNKHKIGIRDKQDRDCEKEQQTFDFENFED